MEYQNVHRAVFVSRPNRFIATVMVNGVEQAARVMTTGRLAELLVTGAEVSLSAAQNENRKTKWDLIAVRKGRRWVNIDSSAPGKVFAEWVRAGKWRAPVEEMKAEVKYGASRLDFMLTGKRGEKTMIEVKGVTLEVDGVGLFPDAPTQRGVRHLYELIDCVKDGYGACGVFVAQMADIDRIEGNRKTDAAFADAMASARAAGVGLIGYECAVTADGIYIANEVKVV